ncbi:MAG: hypothetical protein Q9191_007967 [Dirinaria sp. TL-2023a]
MGGAEEFLRHKFTTSKQDMHEKHMYQAPPPTHPAHLLSPKRGSMRRERVLSVTSSYYLVASDLNGTKILSQQHPNKERNKLSPLAEGANSLTLLQHAFKTKSWLQRGKEEKCSQKRAKLLGSNAICQLLPGELRISNRTTLHGGYSWFTGAYGLECDNMIGIEIVRADGSTVRASNMPSQDLFCAMNGVGSLFGVTTEFVLQGREQKGQVWTGNIVFGKQSLGTILKVCGKVLARENNGTAALCWGWNVLTPGKEPTIWTLPWYNGPEQKALDFFAQLLDSKTLVNRTRMVTFSALGTPSGSAAGRELRKCGHGSSVIAKLDQAFFEKLYADFAAFVRYVPDASKSIIGFEVCNPYPFMRIGQSETAYTNRGYQINVQVIPTWTEEANDKICREWRRAYTSEIEETFQKRKSGKDADDSTKTSVGAYLNYDGKILNFPTI